MRRRRAVWVVAGVGVAALATAGGLSLGHYRSRLPIAASPTVTVTRSAGATEYETSGILFDVGSSDLVDEAVPALATIAGDLTRSHPAGRIQVDGYTDDTGTPDFNQTLSYQRAQTVAGWLQEHGGLDRSRLDVQGHGATSPVVPNDSAAHRQANRRVVVSVVPDGRSAGPTLVPVPGQSRPASSAAPAS